MIAAPCAAHIPLARIPAHVVITRAGHRVAPPRLFLKAGDRIAVSRPATFAFSYAGNSFRIPHARVRLECRARSLTLRLDSGEVIARTARPARSPVVMSREMLALATL